MYSAGILFLHLQGQLTSPSFIFKKTQPIWLLHLGNVKNQQYRKGQILQICWTSKRKKSASGGLRPLDFPIRGTCPYNLPYVHTCTSLRSVVATVTLPNALTQLSYTPIFWIRQNILVFPRTNQGLAGGVYLWVGVINMRPLEVGAPLGHARPKNSMKWTKREREKKNIKVILGDI